MAAFTPTASAVIKGTGARMKRVTAGAAVNAGQLVYADTTDSNKHKLCDADALASSVCAGIALNDAEDGQPLTIQTEGNITINAVATAGRVYTVSTTAGAWATAGDEVSGDFVSVFGIGLSTTSVKLSICNSEVSVA